jgi:PKD repeat protein
VSFTWEESIDNINFEEIAESNGYHGILNDTLEAYTGILNPANGGLWRYYRCRMVSNIYGVNFSDTAFLEINIPPLVDFFWTNPCQGQTVHFQSIALEGGGNGMPASFLWTFGDGAGTSVYPAPSYLYENEGTFEVTLYVEDENGCGSSVTKNVTIYNIPSMQISGKDVVCSNEQDVKYNVDLEGSNIRYKWDISGFGTIENDTLPQITVDWNAVEVPTQKDISLTVTIYPSDTLFCTTKISKEVLITTYVAPPEGTVFRKPYESSVLIYKGPEVNSYKWGYTDSEGDHPADQDPNGGLRLYCDYGALDLENNDYWVETSYDARINCVTRSHFDNKKNEQGWIDISDSFKIFPVPASSYLTIKSRSCTKTSYIAIYNLMMQEARVFKNLMFSQDGCTISLEGLISGIYIIQITDDSGMNHFRVFNIEK